MAGIGTHRARRHVGHGTEVLRSRTGSPKGFAHAALPYKMHWFEGKHLESSGANFGTSAYRFSCRYNSSERPIQLSMRSRRRRYLLRLFPHSLFPLVFLAGGWYPKLILLTERLWLQGVKRISVLRPGCIQFQIESQSRLQNNPSHR